MQARGRLASSREKINAFLSFFLQLSSLFYIEFLVKVCFRARCSTAYISSAEQKNCFGALLRGLQIVALRVVAI